MTHGDFNNLPRGTASDKVSRDKAFYVAKNKKYDGYQQIIVSMAHNFFLIKVLLVVLLHVHSQRP